jgi:flagellar basal-body rod protein FlgG
MQSLNIAATGMNAQQMNVEVISNNIANMNTTGFKRQRAEFQDLIYQAQRRVGTASSDAGTVVPSGIQLGLGVKTAATYRVNEQGALILTDNQFDLSIRGEGYFQITLPNGDTAYTRAGSFQLDQNGTLVTPDGYTVQPGITIPADTLSVTVNESGQVFAQIDGQVPHVLGHAGMVRINLAAG